ncbi:Fungal specific transcription factor domain containing protein [Amanita muscaria]
MVSNQNPIPAPSSLQSALQMDANQHIPQQEQTPEPPQQPAPPSKRRRKTTEGGDDPAAAGVSPGTRRLRRSHEACARCRSKKIKCDSKHPRCTACATAGTPCHQEDRHRQTLTPRGHTERVEYLLTQCTALLKHHVPGFNLENVDEYLHRDGIDVSAVTPPPATTSFQTEQIKPQHPKAYPLYPHPPPHLIPHPPYPPPLMPYGPLPPGHYHPSMQLQGHYNPHLLPAFQHPGVPYQPPPPVSLPHPLRAQTKGQDPNGNDLSSTDSVAKNFGVNATIVDEILPAVHDREDLAVGSNGLSSGRDRSAHERVPRESQHWISITVDCITFHDNTQQTENINVWLPKDREAVQRIVNVYFHRLNVHRPVFSRKEFDKILTDIYDNPGTIIYDPGYICGIYLVLALGTLSELNHQAASEDFEKQRMTQNLGSASIKNRMPLGWPAHEEFFERALAIKPDLRVNISSLQALILVHWYLYTERQGRTLWRLVGSLVRLAVELGLHHDPTTQLNLSTQQSLFTPEEQLMRIRLWAIVLVHDRGTSILLGRPLAISSSDFNTPAPKRSDGNVPDAEFSLHFEQSHPVSEIQADIINSLYTPHRQDKAVIMQHATRIIRKLHDFQKSLPEKYHYYFGGTEDWTLERKSRLVKDITEDEGLTLLKVAIARSLLMRALFISKELPIEHRMQALVDAIITSHNTIVVHNQLIKFPDIAFFTSPIPLHIAAMVLLYGQTSKCDCLPKNTALEDIWLALDLLPRFRWRWERKDANGGHPLIAKVAERVLEVNLQTLHPEPVTNPILLPEPKWDDYSPSPATSSHHPTPTMPYEVPASVQSNGNSGTSVYGPRPRQPDNAVSSEIIKEDTSGPEKSMANFPTSLFYPFYPEAQVPTQGNGSSSNPNSGQGYQEYLKMAATTQVGPYANHSAHEAYIDDTQHRVHQQHQQGMNIWVGVD